MLVPIFFALIYYIGGD